MKHQIMHMGEASADCTCGKTFKVSRTKALRDDEARSNALLDMFNAHKAAAMDAERA